MNLPRDVRPKNPKWSAALLGSILSAAIASVPHSSDALYMTWWGLMARDIFSFSLRKELTAWKVWLHNIIIRLLETPPGNGMTHLRRWFPSCRSCATNPLQSNTGPGWLSAFSDTYMVSGLSHLTDAFVVEDIKNSIERKTRIIDMRF